jgi:hypothetical protein
MNTKTAQAFRKTIKEKTDDGLNFDGAIKSIIMGKMRSWLKNLIFELFIDKVISLDRCDYISYAFLR